MIHHLHQPKPKLAKYVSAIIYNKDYYPEHTMDKYLPDGTMNIVFDLSGNSKFIYDNTSKEKLQEFSKVWFAGVLKEYITISAESEEMLVVVFKPGAGYPLSHKSAAQFTDSVLPAEQVVGASILELHQTLSTPTEMREKFEAIENWLSGRLKEDDFYTNIIQYAVEKIQSSSAQIGIKQLAEKSGYSQKQFIALFKKYVGITPKQLHKIVRFNEILSAVQQDQKLSWARIAADCGYFDQSHFIKDFQSFSGINPQQYLSDIGDYPNFFPMK